MYERTSSSFLPESQFAAVRPERSSERPFVLPAPFFRGITQSEPDEPQGNEDVFVRVLLRHDEAAELHVIRIGAKKEEVPLHIIHQVCSRERVEGRKA